MTARASGHQACVATRHCRGGVVHSVQDAPDASFRCMPAGCVLHIYIITLCHLSTPIKGTPPPPPPRHRRAAAAFVPQPPPAYCSRRRRTWLLPQNPPWRSRTARWASMGQVNLTTAFSVYSLCRVRSRTLFRCCSRAGRRGRCGGGAAAVSCSAGMGGGNGHAKCPQEGAGAGWQAHPQAPAADCQRDADQAPGDGGQAAGQRQHSGSTHVAVAQQVDALHVHVVVLEVADHILCSSAAAWCGTGGRGAGRAHEMSRHDGKTGAHRRGPGMQHDVAKQASTEARAPVDTAWYTVCAAGTAQCAQHAQRARRAPEVVVGARLSTSTYRPRLLITSGL